MQTKQKYEEAGKAHAEGTYLAARDILLESIKLCPEKAEAYLLLGMSYSKLDEHTSAIKILELGFEKSSGPDRDRARWYMGNAYAWAGKFPEARRELEQVVKGGTIYSQQASELLAQCPKSESSK